MEDIQAEIEGIKKKLEENPIPKLDANGDGHISTGEVWDWAKMVAREYIWLYFALILAIISFYKPDNLDDWKNVLMLGLSLSAVIYGGYLKRNFQQQFFQKEQEKHEIEAERDANKQALLKATSELAQLRLERDFWKSRVEKLEKKLFEKQ